MRSKKCKKISKFSYVSSASRMLFKFKIVPHATKLDDFTHLKSIVVTKCLLWRFSYRFTKNKTSSVEDNLQLTKFIQIGQGALSDYWSIWPAGNAPTIHCFVLKSKKKFLLIGWDYYTISFLKKSSCFKDVHVMLQFQIFLNSLIKERLWKEHQDFHY